MAKSMNIGIVTINDITNYGNRLQNYALFYLLKTQFKYQVTTLVSKKEKPFYNGYYIAWIKEFVARCMCYISPTVAERRFGPNISRWTNFYIWDKKILKKHYYGDDKLPEKIDKDYDYFFVGSDQVWNYHFSSSRFYNYFLRFAEDTKKIAISASFGVDHIPENWKDEYIDGLKHFAHISVREDAGRGIVMQLLGRDVPVLIDPVMMLTKEQWLKVSKKPRVDCGKPYILKYYLGDELEEDKINKWAYAHGFEVYELLDKKRPDLYSAGPGEFITLIYNAAMICSDSFHCIAFSIIFEKPFIAYYRRGKDDQMSSRLTTLLNKFGLQNRWKHKLAEEDYLKCEYEPVKMIMENEKRKFIEFINMAISNVG